MTTTGYADFTPRSIYDWATVNVIMLTGMLVFGAIVAVIADGLKHSQAEARVSHRGGGRGRGWGWGIGSFEGGAREGVSHRGRPRAQPQAGAPGEWRRPRKGVVRLESSTPRRRHGRPCRHAPLAACAVPARPLPLSLRWRTTRGAS